ADRPAPRQVAEQEAGGTQAGRGFARPGVEVRARGARLPPEAPENDGPGARARALARGRAVLPRRCGGDSLYPAARSPEDGQALQGKHQGVVRAHAGAALGEKRDARSHDPAGQGAVRSAAAGSVAEDQDFDGGGGMRKLLAMLLALGCAAAQAQNYPNRAVRVVVAAQTGGPDIVARVVAAELQAQMGQPFVVENQGG